MEKFLSPEVADLILKLGIGALSILGMIYVIVKAQKEREKNQKSFMSYIETNNHQTTALVEKCSVAITIASEATKEHTESVKSNNELMKLVLSSILNKKN